MKDKIAAWREKHSDFWKTVSSKEGVKSTSSGLHYEIIEQGEGIPGPTDMVTVHYHGYRPDGFVFDSSVRRNEPVEFPLDQVVPGFSEGLQLIGKGGDIRLYIPPELAYGEHDIPGIPAGTPLVFEIQLLEVRKA